MRIPHSSLKVFGSDLFLIEDEKASNGNPGAEPSLLGRNNPLPSQLWLVENYFSLMFKRLLLEAQKEYCIIKWDGIT